MKRIALVALALALALPVIGLDVELRPSSAQQEVTLAPWDLGRVPFSSGPVQIFWAGDPVGEGVGFRVVRTWDAETRSGTLCHYLVRVIDRRIASFGALQCFPIVAPPEPEEP